MDERITELYQAAGVDTDSFEHKLRQRWNRLDRERRCDVLGRVREHPRRYSGRRWDQLPTDVQRSIIRSIRLQNRRQQHDARQQAN